MANTLERTHGTIDYDAGSTVTIDLPRSHFYERLNLLAEIDLTVDDAEAGPNGAGILDLIEDISVTFDGSQTIKSTSFSMSHMIDWYQYQTRPTYSEPDWETAGDQTVEMGTFVDFLVSPGQFGAMLPSFQFSDLTLSIKWATADAVSDGLTINDASVQVESNERKRRSVPTKSKPMKQILDRLHGFKETERTRQIGVSGQTSVNLPRGNAYYAIPIQVFDAGTPSNDLVEGITVEENGVSTHLDTTFSLARALDKQQYGIEDRPPGFVYLNYGVGGDLSDVVSTANMDDFQLHLNTESNAPTDPAEVRVVTQEIVQ